MKKTDTELAFKILQSIREGVFAVDENLVVTFFNRGAADITGVTCADALGLKCSEILRADCCSGECPLKETIKTGQPLAAKKISLLDSKGHRKNAEITAALLVTTPGNEKNAVIVVREIIESEIAQDTSPTYSLQDILSVNQKMQKLFKIMPLIAESASNVLVEGESGTGKELFAKAIHRLSQRRDKPFIALNCAALPDTLLESELFGYKAGAFTDAKKDKPGRFKIAGEGTLFLDEIGDISPAIQVKLLRVLQERTYEPLGAVKSETADVRIICATNQNLKELVEKGLFRRDLFYRINVVSLNLPPLREKPEDIPLLAEHFIRKFNEKQNKSVIGLSDAVWKKLATYDFPGNVRELENIIERAFVLCKDGPIELEHLPEHLAEGGVGGSANLHSGDSLKEVEAAFLINALERNNHNKAKTAAELGMHKTTLYRKLKKLGIE